jgi:hypothetical protein
MNALARSASEFNALRVFCSERFPMDAEKTQRAELMYMDIGIHSFGEKRFRAELLQEYTRRYKEVKITGPAQWCAYQRDHIERLDPNFFIKP